MNRTCLHVLAALTLTGSLTAVLTGLATTAHAHPLGNFTVNHHTGLTFRQDAVDAVIVVDRAEIATAQERPGVDRDHNGVLDPAERSSFAAQGCAVLARQLHLDIAGTPVRWRTGSSSLTYHQGEGGLQTSRMACTLTAPAGLAAPADIGVRTGYDERRIGWQEMTARGQGVTLTRSPLPATSPTDELRHYPKDPLATPLNQRSARLHTEPGDGRSAAATRTVLPGAGPLTAALGKVSAAFDSLVGQRELTVPAGLLALLLSLVLGASHAALPGHGKTIMAAYLAGRRGTPRDAVTVGVTVTFTHTAGVLALGLALPVATSLAGETVLTWLGLISGLMVTCIGLWLLHTALTKGAGHHHHAHGHGHDHGHSHGHHHHGHHHGDAHEHDVSSPSASHQADHHHDHGTQATPRSDPPSATRLLPERRQPGATSAEEGGTVLAPAKRDTHTHSHTPPSARTGPVHGARTSRTGLIGMGIAGGLVPSPSALVVLLGAVALGRTAFGVLLVVGYGLGMAATLTLAGLLLVRLRDRIEARADKFARLRAPAARLSAVVPAASAGLVLLVGVLLTLRAVAGPW
ncbi:HoxN/HupN/NixA family nickel/cobalt transporter [Streptomyces sp. NBC_01257]|uniref:HoxN/HupN/NixA family nickel/cobalt transporter n=1 Tax=Streptomyces sp. NBC_01257 TaxID=2903799 RepID=UPI002DD80C6B|nr:sulfite exporter TauE/SafE family protein [Streptomyces sp. NBC_01257]WRZ69540.1 nickel transporter [Streptomyces sp. NBC_01257]